MAWKMSGDFILHERLAADTVALADWPLCRVLLMNDASYPWLILVPRRPDLKEIHDRSEEHTSELQSLMRNSYAVFCLKKKKITKKQHMRKATIKTVQSK